jgi:putative addiction module killer protein
MYTVHQSEIFESWIEALRDRKGKLIVAGRLARLERGAFGDTKPVGDGIRELRIHFGPGYRIYFQLRGSEIILLLCGGNKSSQAADIERAKLVAKAWEN